MQITQLRKDDDAVSPVIGVILMVAITVILAAVIAAFVLGLGPGDSAPQAQFDLEGDSGEITITHSTGEKIDPGPTTIQWDGPTNSGSQDLTDGDVSGSRMSSGNSVPLGSGSLDGTYTVSVIYDMGDSSSTIFEEDVSVSP